MIPLRKGSPSGVACANDRGMSDVKTLRLASAQLTTDLLEGFLVYQRALVGLLSTSASGASATWAGRFAFAHSQALAESKLDALTQQRLKVLVSEYCGKRSAWMTVKQRAADAERAVHEAQAHGKPAPTKELGLIERVKTELSKLDDFSAFSDRYGGDALELLRTHDLEIVTLHRDLSRLEGSGGHVHPA